MCPGYVVKRLTFYRYVAYVFYFIPAKKREKTQNKQKTYTNP